MSTDLEAGLRHGLQALALPLSDEQVQKLLDYQAWVAKWNKVYNLTAVRDPMEMLTHHLLDSLAVIAPLMRQLGPGIDAAKVLDVGSGAGLPGVVIAIACPQVQVTCVDTVAKKAVFVQQVAAALRLPNLKGLHARVENVAEPFDVVTSRAFASLLDFTQWSAQALGPAGVWMALKGKVPAAEMQALPDSVEVFHVEQLKVPGLDAERCLLWMRKAGLNSGLDVG
ncbi:MAG: rRNA ((527)-N(7))-methyltransferase RsmG [Pseudomonadota bacterium]|jgi:16S rRNA (guanine527-N7)-methyltransferase